MATLLHKCQDSSVTEPVFGFVLLGGSLTGALIHDIRLANELHRRGFKVCVWWVVDRPQSSPLDPGIAERWLFHSFRYATGHVSDILDVVGRLACHVLSDGTRSKISQRIPWVVGGTLRGIIKQVCNGIASDTRLIRSFARELTDAGVTHAMATIEILTPFIKAARDLVPHQLKYVVQFQGYETQAPYAAQLGLEQAMYDQIRDAVESSDWPAISVSEPYSERVQQEIGLPAAAVRVVHPGIPVTDPVDLQHAQELVLEQFPTFNRDVPLISYLGRRDSEKGIDLLIYAAQILREMGTPFQLPICGPTAFGSRYGVACRQIAQVMKLPVLSSDYLTNELRAALFRASHCVVYPSIHEEAFGMVPLEAMVQGTPVVVPDTGGVSQLPFLGILQSGLLFRSWDSGDLASQLHRLLSDAALHQRFSKAAPRIAAHYSIENFTDRTLDHLDLPHRPGISRIPAATVLPQRRAA